MNAVPIDLPSDDLESVDDYFYEQGWSDGLPIVPPTPDRVARMLGENGFTGDELIGEIPVKRLVADMRNIAVNCVMAGCRPQHMPAVVAYLRAVVAPGFGLDPMAATTHVCAPLAIFGGPVVQQLGINCGAGLFGAGNRANAVIGRALQLILRNIGGVKSPDIDKATFGHPGKFTYVAAENEAINPWPSLREDHGFGKAQSAVTAFAAEAPHNVNDHNSQSAEGLLVTIAGTMATLGTNNLLMSGPVLIVMSGEHASVCAREGMSKDDVRKRLYELATFRVGDVWWENRRKLAIYRPDPFATAGPDDMAPLVDSPDLIHLTVFGGPGRHSLVIPTFGAACVPQTVALS